MLKRFKSFKPIIYYCLPVIGGIIAVLLILGTKGEVFGVFISMLSFWFNALIVPIYLVLCNIFIKKIGFVRKIFYSFLSISLSKIIDFSAWWLTTGQLDPMTGVIFYYLLLLTCLIVFGCLFCQIVFRFIAPFLGPYKFELKPERRRTKGVR